jgi:ankyrin repeat protein
MKFKQLLFFSLPCAIFLAGCAEDPSVETARNSLRNINTPFTGTAFERAIIDGDIEKVDLFIEGKMPLGKTQTINPLLTAVIENKKEIVKRLLENNADPDITSEFGTPLCVAATKGYTDIFKILLEAGADPDYIQGTINPVINAAAAGHTEIIQLLIDEGADIDAEGEQTLLTPLMLAAKNGHTDIVRLLISEGADIDAVDYRGKTALDQAIIKNNIDITKLLLQDDIFDSGDNALASLALAISLNQFQIANLLIKKGVDINEQYGDMPLLSWCIYNDYIKGAKLLIKSGADITQKDKHNRIALDYALMKKDQKLIDELKLKMIPEPQIQ